MLLSQVVAAMMTVIPCAEPPEASPRPERSCRVSVQFGLKIECESGSGLGHALKQLFKNGVDAASEVHTPIMPPVPKAGPVPTCVPPTDREVLQALHPKRRGVPFVHEHHRDHIHIVKERIVDKVDPARKFPIVGKAQLHHCHWKCTVFSTETIQSGGPFPVKLTRKRVEVVYIDKDFLHQVATD